MYESNLANALWGVGFLLSTIYNANKFVKLVKKHKRYSECLDICEKAERNRDTDTPMTVDEYLTKYDKNSKERPPAYLTGDVMHKIYAERLNQGITDNKGYDQLDLYVKTTDISHGFRSDEHYEQSPFYLFKNKKVLVDLQGEDYPPVLGTRRVSELESKNYFYLPLYWLGLTSITSYDVEYISSTSTVNVWGVVDWDAKTSEFSLSEPVLMFVGSIKNALIELKDKISGNTKGIAFYAVATAFFGFMCYYQFSHLHKKIALDIEDAKITKSCRNCRNNEPTMLRRSCMHISECRYWWQNNERMNPQLNKQCPLCGEISSSVHEVRK